MIKSPYECNDCTNKFVIVYVEEGDSPQVCPFCGEECLLNSEETEEIFSDYL